jgi:predicted DCC family thiol-disulfide oxidoreductase YuxK
LLADHPALAEIDSLLLFEEGRIHARSEAALRVARHLRWPWRALGLLRLVPGGLRDAVYDAIAARRQRWFGRTACVRPAQLVADRFVSD